MKLKIHPENPQKRHLTQVKEVLDADGVIIFPTDTVYSIGCKMSSKKAFEKVCLLKGIKPEKAKFSFIFDDFKTIGQYAIHISTPVFKMMKRVLPGPYTFILEASKEVPSYFRNTKRRTIGVRLVDHNVTNSIIRELREPLVTTSLHSDDEIVQYIADPDEIYEEYGKRVDLVVDSGPGELTGSTIVDCSDGEENIEIIREGLGSVEALK